MVALKRTAGGGFKARKRLPVDVASDYARLYGPKREAKFARPASTSSQQAKQDFHEWLVEVEGRIATIRAQRDGTGLPLTSVEARRLAGEWYGFWTNRHSADSRADLERLQDEVNDSINSAIGEEHYGSFEPGALWEAFPEARELVHPMLADAGETAQFLASKSMVLSPVARRLFLDWLYLDMAEALKLLFRRLEGDHRPDGYSDRFPKSADAISTIQPLALFDRYVAECTPAASTIETWGYMLKAADTHFGNTPISSEEASKWIKSLVSSDRSARTVANGWLRALKRVYSWSVEQRLTGSNPFADVKISVPRKAQLRERSFHPSEISTILNAAFNVRETKTPDQRARRWVPWIAYYSGARPGEITQLRKCDVVQREGVWALNLTPDAGTIKSGSARTVPLHEHLILQGFLSFVEARPDGPLFYRPAKAASSPSSKRPTKPRSVQARQRLAAWVRSVGVTDEGLSPLHAFRHSFKQIADRHGIGERVSDAITGHAPATVGQSYGRPTLSDLAQALKLFPRFEVHQTQEGITGDD